MTRPSHKMMKSANDIVNLIVFKNKTRQARKSINKNKLSEPDPVFDLYEIDYTYEINRK